MRKELINFIRKAKKEDLKEIAEIFRKESMKKPYSAKYSPASALKDITECFKDGLYVAIDDGKIVGFIASHIISSDKKKAYIDELWIRHNYQGKGFGKMLTKFIEDIYKKKGLSGMRLTTKKRSEAYGFYNKLKYKDADLVYMEKKL